MSSIQNLSKTPGSNTSVAGINIAEGMTPGYLNNAARLHLAWLKMLVDDIGGVTETTGSSNTYAAASNGSFETLATGILFAFKANHSNTGAATLNVTPPGLSALGAKAIRKFTAAGEGPLTPGEIVDGCFYVVRYDSAANGAAGGWVLLNPTFGIREKLTANRSYYVRADGSDSNTGLADTAGGAFLTIQKAVDVVTNNIDLGGFDVTIYVADGTYTAPVVVGAQTGDGDISILGNIVTPANCVISTTSDDAIFVAGAKVNLYGLKLQTTTSGAGLKAYLGAVVNIGYMDFGVCVAAHMELGQESVLSAGAAYNITGGAASHIHCGAPGTFTAGSFTVTITGTPAFGSYFIGIAGGRVDVSAVTWSGSATGKRFLVHENGILKAGSTSLTKIPGNSAGTTSSGGKYSGDETYPDVIRVVRQIFTSSGTYTPTVGMVECDLECVGGGGGGGPCGSVGGQQHGGGGGGSGGYSKKRASAADIGASKTVTIGAGGAGGTGPSTEGSNGGATSVGSLCVANGGGCGLSNPSGGANYGNSGAGASAGTGDITIPGHAGARGPSATSLATGASSGDGGSSLMGAGGRGVGGTGTGSAGGNYGGGGAGGMVYNATASSDGGAGAPGIVIVTEYIGS